jgi:hypothetical protein
LSGPLLHAGPKAITSGTLPGRDRRPKCFFALAQAGHAPLQKKIATIFATSYYVTQSVGGHAVREHFQAIIIAGLIAGVMGGAWMWINRYEIKPHDSESFRVRDRLTGQVELCAAMIVDNNTTYKTYCGAELQRRRKDQMLQESSAKESPAF